MSNPDKLAEINKVSRRLKLWAKRPHQINAKILNSYLEMMQSGCYPIKESDLAIKMAEEISFKSNFIQMKNITEKNHGKVFEQEGENIFLWEPIVSLVRQYQKTVLGDRS